MFSDEQLWGDMKGDFLAKRNSACSGFVEPLLSVTVLNSADELGLNLFCHM